MAKRLTIHAGDSPRETWVEVDGERLDGIQAVQFAEVDGEPRAATLIFDPWRRNAVEIVDERGGDGN